MGDGGFGTKGRVGGLKHWGGWGGGKGRKWRNLLGLAVRVLCFNGVGAVHSVCCCCCLLLAAAAAAAAAAARGKVLESCRRQSKGFF